MFKVDGTRIVLNRGDTGSVDFTVTGYEFGENDRAVFSVQNGHRQIVKQQAYELVDGQFTVMFFHGDTDWLPAGEYKWGITIFIDPIYDEEDRIVDGSQVITPLEERQPLLLLDTAGIA